MALRPLDKLGRYELIREIARSNDIVYEGWDPQTQRRVAVKALNLPIGAASALRQDRTLRFEREARAAARLHHPNIVTLFDFGTDQEQPFLVFEFVDGPTLTDILLQQGPLHKQQAIGYACQLLAALSYAHGQKVIHRDVKPSNIFICGEDHLKIADLGIARIESEESVTTDGQIFGTPAYMAPEQVKGQPIDRRVDIWAAGAVLYQMLTGVQSFSGGSVLEIGSNVLNKEPNLLLIQDADLRATIAKALAKDPGARFNSAAEMSSALKNPVAASRAPQVVPNSSLSSAIAPNAGPYPGQPTVSLKPPGVQKKVAGNSLLAWALVCLASASLGACAVLWETRQSPEASPASPTQTKITPAVEHKSLDEVLDEALEHNSLRELAVSDAFRVLPRGSQIDQLDTWCRSTIGSDYMALTAAWRNILLDDLYERLSINPIRVADAFPTAISNQLPASEAAPPKPFSSITGQPNGVSSATDPSMTVTTEFPPPNRPVPPNGAQFPPQQSVNNPPPSIPPGSAASQQPADASQKVWPDQKARDLDDLEVLRKLNFRAEHVKVLPGGVREYSGPDGVVRIR